MRTAVWATFLVITLAAGCDNSDELQPHEDFPVVAVARAGEREVYLSEMRRMGRYVYLVFKYRDEMTSFYRTSISCAEITGGIDTEFEKTVSNGWIELRCKTDYPIETRELEFVLRLCEEPPCENADIVLQADVPPVGEVIKPNESGRAAGVVFSIEAVANLLGEANPEVSGQPRDDAFVLRYGEKSIVADKGNETLLGVVCKAVYPDAVPDLPRGYSEWDQVVLITDRGEQLGGAKSTDDSGQSRYFALVSVGRERIPRSVKACFFSASKLASLRREFVFSDLANPGD